MEHAASNDLPEHDYHMLIGGALVRGSDTIDVINPANERVVARCPRASVEDLDAAIASANAAFPAWSAKSFEERGAVLLACAEMLEANVDRLAIILTSEQGKPISDAKAEVLGTAYYFRFFATRRLELTLLEDSDTRRIEAHRKPLGVIGAIVPWNYPLILMAFKLPAALLAGNTVVLKPAATTPLATLKFGELVADLFPPGVLNVIADANDLGAAISAHPGVRKISFTGSTETGKHVMAASAATLKRLTLELGGNDAALVLDDVDPKRIAPALFAGAFGNNGQTCIAIKRLYVADAVYDAVCGELAALADTAVVGDGFAEHTQFGPLQNRTQFNKVQALIDDSREHGEIIAGGTRVGDVGYFIRPTIVRDITEGSRLVDEEQFGPVLPVIRFADIDDAVLRANSSEFGLGGSVWSSDPERAYRVADRLQAGTVWINKHMDLTPDIPFGGMKYSGMGYELGDQGLTEFTQLKIVNSAR